MNTAYNNTTNVQESRNRYNALLEQAPQRLKARKTDKTAQPEEVTTATPEEVTTTTEPTATTPTQQPEEVTTQQPEEVTTEEVTAPATDDATLLRDVIEQYGNMGADYLDTLDYTQATKQEPRTVMFGRAKVTEKRYTIGAPDEFGNLTTYGLERHYNRNGKRAMFTVYKDGRAIELRWYGENNNTYHAELRCGECGDLVVRYKVEGGKVIRAERIKYGYPIEMERATFDDTNRPATPRDLPAPAPTKTTKEKPATTKEEQPTSKTAPTTEIPQPETTTATEVTTANTDPAPYWLLLDQELQAQQEEQEQALATEKNVPSKSRRQIIEEMRRGAEYEKSNYILPLIAAMRKETGEKWNVPKYGAVIVTAKNIPWYFRYFNYLKTQPARDIEAIETEARNLRTQLEKRIKSGREFLPYSVEILDMAEEYISVIIELYSTKGRKNGSISEIEMHDIIGKQIRYAIEAFDKTGDRFFGINNMVICFRNVASAYNNIKSGHNAKHPAPAPTPEATKQEEPMHAPPNAQKDN